MTIQMRGALGRVACRVADAATLARPGAHYIMTVLFPWALSMEVHMPRLAPELRPATRGSVLVVAALVAAPALLTFASDADAQAPRDRAAWQVPRTVHGHPDLQGNWTNSTLTPFERRDGDGPVYSWDEVARIEAGTEECPPNPGTVACGRAQRAGDSNEARLSGNEYNEVYWERGTKVAVVRGQPRTSLVTRPANGRIPDLTPAARRALEERSAFRSQFGQYDHPELRPFAERCILFGSPLGPPMIPVGAYNSNYVITQTADAVMIQSEMIHDVRVIRLGEPKPLPKNVRPYFGDSWGRWDGNVLVVETTNISPEQSIAGGPLSEDAKVTERFTRVDEETILYEFTVDDPKTFTQPWGGEIPIFRLHAELYEYACHEGNYSLPGVLSGARYEESQAARN